MWILSITGPDGTYYYQGENDWDTSYKDAKRYQEKEKAQYERDLLTPDATNPDKGFGRRICIKRISSSDAIQYVYDLENGLRAADRQYRDLRAKIKSILDSSPP